MKILIVGNLGYIGPSVVSQLRESYPDAELLGFDIGYFAHCLSNASYLPETRLNAQHFGDIRAFPERLLEGVDALLNLAAISNDPMGNEFEAVTMAVNHAAAVRLAEAAKKAGVRNYVYASSCSIYGAGGDSAKTETDTMNPLTAYARSKVAAENDLAKLADSTFIVTCLRFATACGFTNRLRLDLVLNDFVAGAVVNRRIDILSDGSPWRPLINTRDMARAFEWAAARKADIGGAFLAVNTGSSDWNVQIRDLAEAVARVIPGVDVSINRDASPDKRSYRVNFDLFRRLAPDHQPQWGLEQTIGELHRGLTAMNFADANYRESTFIRLKVLASLRAGGELDSRLEWHVPRRARFEMAS
ncbi:MAG: SDR family oxidoreductase [Pseudomonadales bacterium]|nr:SDR family oxidoreductase [Pseudomonadales bacterium]